MRPLFIYLFIGFLWTSTFFPGYFQASYHRLDGQVAFYLCQEPLAQKAPCCVFNHGTEQASLRAGMLPSESYIKNDAIAFNKSSLDLSSPTQSSFKFVVTTPNFLHTIRTTPLNFEVHH